MTRNQTFESTAKKRQASVSQSQLRIFPAKMALWRVKPLLCSSRQSVLAHSSPGRFDELETWNRSFFYRYFFEKRGEIGGKLWWIVLQCSRVYAYFCAQSRTKGKHNIPAGFCTIKRRDAVRRPMGCGVIQNKINYAKKIYPVKERRKVAIKIKINHRSA